MKVNFKGYEYVVETKNGEKIIGYFSIREDVPVEKVVKQLGRTCKLVNKFTLEL